MFTIDGFEYDVDVGVKLDEVERLKQEFGLLYGAEWCVVATEHLDVKALIAVV